MVDPNKPNKLSPGDRFAIGELIRWYAPGYFSKHPHGSDFGSRSYHRDQRRVSRWC